MSLSEVVLNPPDPKGQLPLEVSLVQRHLIPAIWSRVAGYLKDATDRSEGRYNLDDLYANLVNDEHWHLWVVYEPDLTVVAAITSTFTDYPRMRVLHGQFLGGERLDDWQDMFCEIFDRWARDNGCHAVEFTGRHGWGRPLKRSGYRPIFTIFQRDLQ